MGKTPEKVNGSIAGSTAPVMRYRRKVSTTVVVAEPVAMETPQQEDNQMEHREPEPVEGDSGNVKCEAKQQILKQKPLKPGGPARKKKPKATVTATEAPSHHLVGVTAATAATATHKKKLKKRQLSNNHNVSEATEVTEATEAADVHSHPLPQQQCVDQGAEAVKHKPNHQSSNQTQTNDANSGKHNGPSLLKQLLWKTKPTAPLTSHSGPHSGYPLPMSAQRKHKQKKPKKSPQPSVADQEEQEEREYALNERHARKLQAAKNGVTTQPLVTDSCSAVAVVSSELSSQETQSGSDDDEATTAFMTAFENLVPSTAMEPPPHNLSPTVRLNVFYPSPFPLAFTTDTSRLEQHGIQVHEILIEDFTFYPQQLRIQPGDVVVWKVSGETLAMVEHSLEGSLKAHDPKHKKPAFVKATAPPLGSGSAFAWRFEMPARVHIECSVYKTKGVIIVGNAKPKKEKKSEKAKPAAFTVEVGKDASSAAPPLTKQQKKKQKVAQRKRAAAEARAVARAESDHDHDHARGQDSMDSDAVFHPSHNLACSTDMDAGVCRAVLAHLEEVVAAVHAAADVIVIGDVECPVVPDDSSNQEEVENSSANVHVADKPSVVADEGSGTDEDEDDDDGDHGTLTHTGENAMEGFQQRIIGMLKRSEDARAQHRLSFQHENSGFDAGAAYDFFKQRFMRVQEERQIVYAVCAEQPSESGVSVTDVVRLFSH